jgi:hypothetical protein
MTNLNLAAVERLTSFNSSEPLLRETSLAEMALQAEPTATRTATASGNEASSGAVVVH